MIINFMINIAKGKNIFTDKPSEDDVNRMYNQICGNVLSLNKNTRSESYSWHSHVRYISKTKNMKES